MKLPPRLRLEPRTSRIGAMALLASTMATAVLMFVTLREPWICAMVVVAIGAVGVTAVRTVQKPPLLMHVGVDRRVRMTLRDGRIVDGTVHSDTSVGAWLTALVWQPDGARWFTPAGTLLVLPDMLSADDFRRLRVYLRYGRLAADGDTSGVSAG